MGRKERIRELRERTRARKEARQDTPKSNTDILKEESKQRPSRFSLPCQYEGAILEWCDKCNGEMKHIRDCEKHERCTRGEVSPLIQACVTCESYTPQTPEKARETHIMLRKQRQRKALAQLLNKRKERGERSESQPTQPDPGMKGFKAGQSSSPLVWEYGITTVEQRRRDLLPVTIESLHKAGFVNPRLFVDGCKDIAGWENEFGLYVVARSTNIRTFGNWFLALIELYIRNPHAHRYALFQDDVIACKGLREYLECTPYPEKGYLNLITYPQNEQYKRLHFKGLPEEEMTGWYPSNQLGKGAQGLVFNREAVVILLSHQHMIERPQDDRRGWRGVDGGIVTAFKKAGWTEYVHSPSLLRHTGEITTMGNPRQPEDLSFRGENWDAMSLVRGDIQNTDMKVSLPVVSVKEDVGAPMVKRVQAQQETTGTAEKD